MATIHDYSQIEVWNQPLARVKLGLGTEDLRPELDAEVAARKLGDETERAGREAADKALEDEISGKEDPLSFELPLNRVGTEVSWAGTTTDVPEGSNLYWTAARFAAEFAAKTTTDLAEGANLYYTAARFNTAFSGKTTTDLTEGVNLYYTAARFSAAFAAKSTTDLSEGTNLYYTQGRFDTAFSAKSTTNLSEGTNLYYTQARFDTAFGAKTTTNLTEGANLYYTDARARAAFSATAPVALSAGGVISMAAATASVDGYLTAANFVVFNAKVATSRSIATTSPVIGGGDLSADRTIALDFTVAWTWTANGIAATPTDRIQLSNTTAAAAGAQQYSPALRLTGQGWKTDATAASRAVDWRIYNQPVQGTANPTAAISFDFSVNAGSFTQFFTILPTTTQAGLANSASITFPQTPFTIAGESRNSEPVLTFFQSNTGVCKFGPTSGITANNVSIGWNNSLNSAQDLSLFRDGADALAQRRTTNAQTTRIYNTFTSSTNFERLDLQWASNVAQIWTEKGSGGGTARDLVLGADATEVIRCQTGTKLGFYGVTPVARSSAYSITNVTTDRAYDANATSLDEIADVLGTLVSDLRAVGLLT